MCVMRKASTVGIRKTSRVVKNWWQLPLAWPGTRKDLTSSLH